MTRLGHLRGRFDSALLVPIAGAVLLVLAVPSGRLVFVVAGIVGLACLVAGFFRPGATLALLFVAVLLVEQEFLAGAFAGQRRFYEPVISKLTLPDLLLACIAAGVLATRRRNVGSGSLAVPSAVLLLATFGACVTGLFADANHPELLRQARPIAYLCVVPIIVAHVWDREILLKRALDVFMAIVLLKAVQAILTAVTGIGLTGLRASGGVLVVQTQAPAMILSAAMLLVVTLTLARVDFPRWWLWSAAVSAVGVGLLLRRGVWLGDIVAVAALVGYFSLRRGNRRRGVLAAFVLVAGLAAVVVTTTSATSSRNPVVERVQTLTLAKAVSSRGDRYRIDEQRNIVWNIARHPFIGIGLGTGWDAPYALPFQFQAARSYSHNVLTYMWLRLGLVGLLAFLALWFCAVRSAVRTERRHADRLIGASTLAVGATLIAFLISGMGNAELGVTDRGSLFAVMLLGYIVAAERSAAQRLASA